MWQDVEVSKVLNNDRAISFPLDTTINQIKASEVKLQAFAKNGSVIVNLPVSLAECVTSEEKVNFPGKISFGLDNVFTDFGMTSRVSFFEATRPISLTFETLEVAGPKVLTFETLEIAEPQLTVSTTFNDSEW